MENQAPEIKELVARMKAIAQEHAAVPVRPPRQECYYHFANGLNLCLTVDILTMRWVTAMSRLPGVEVPQEMAGAKFWHLSVARLGNTAPTDDETEFWSKAFFEEAPVFQMKMGVVPRVSSRHFFWKYE